MKHFLLFATFISVIATAQVRFQPLSLDDAVNQAALTGKLVFAQFTSSNCDRCNQLAELAFEKPELADLVNKRCIAIKIDQQSAYRHKFIEEFNPDQVIGTYFISGGGELIHRFAGTASTPAPYIQQVNTAFNKLTEGVVTFRELNDEWDNNPGNIAAMEKNLNKRLSVGLPTDSLLEVYLHRLPVDSFQSKRVIKFVINLAPSIFSPTYRTIHKDDLLFREAWFEMPLAQRSNINRRITSKSLRRAVQLKSEPMAFNVSSFCRGTFTDKSSLAAREASNRQLLYFYRGIKDTTKYLPFAAAHYDRFFMNLTPVEMKEQDSISRQNFLTVLKSRNLPDSVIDRLMVAASKNRLISFAGELNNGAWLIYTSSNDTAYLNKALSWIEKALEFAQFAALMDTYAKLLYKTGNKTDAVKWETKAIEASVNNKYDRAGFEAVLSRMKKGEFKID